MITSQQWIPFSSTLSGPLARYLSQHFAIARNRPSPSSSARLDSTFSRLESLDPQTWLVYSANTVGRNRSTQHPWGSNLDIALLYD